MTEAKAAPRGRGETLRAALLAALAESPPKTGAALAVIVGRPAATVKVMLYQLRKAGQARRVGTVPGWGKPSQLWALGAETAPPPAPPPPPSLPPPPFVMAPPRVRVKREGSGVIAPAPYRSGFRWGGVPGAAVWGSGQWRAGTKGN